MEQLRGGVGKQPWDGKTKAKQPWDGETFFSFLLVMFMICRGRFHQEKERSMGKAAISPRDPGV